MANQDGDGWGALKGLTPWCEKKGGEGKRGGKEKLAVALTVFSLKPAQVSRDLQVGGVTPSPR